MKTIYFVRHGESEANIGEPHTAESPLTMRGMAQARFIAERAAQLPIECVVASTMTRAQQTAAVIARKIGKEVESIDIIVECKKTSRHDGKSKHDAEALSLDTEINSHFAEPGYRHSDEENFDDLKSRAAEVLAYLEARPEKHIMVVTHGYFLRVLVAYVTFGPALTAAECQHFLKTFHTENTGISVFRYKADKPVPWSLWIWNDHSHLADA